MRSWKTNDGGHHILVEEEGLRVTKGRGNSEVGGGGGGKGRAENKLGDLERDIWKAEITSCLIISLLIFSKCH